MDRFFNPFMMKEDISINKYFQKLINDISNIAGLASDMVKNTILDTLTTWEKFKFQDITDLFYLNPQKRLEEIKNILNLFNQKIEKIVPSKNLVETTIKLADQNLKTIFHLDRININQII